MKLALLFVLLSTAAFASTDCQSTFQSGAGDTRVKFCVTSNGNVAVFDVSQIEVPLIAGEEGYALQDPTNGGLCYFDIGIGDSGWQPSSITQPHGANTFPLSITRTTSDGYFTLTQSFKWVSGKAGIAVTMSVSTIPARPVLLVRYAHAVGDSFPKFGDKTYNTSFVWTQAPQGSGGGVGLNAALTPDTLARAYLATPGNPCLATFPENLPYAGDSATFLHWQFPKGTHVARFSYSALR